MMTTDRDQFVGGYTTHEAREALRADARKHNVSVSQRIHDILVERFGEEIAALLSRPPKHD